jgi:hypothetical protein
MSSRWQPSAWPWRHSPQVSGVRYARLRATSPTYGVVMITIVAEPGTEQYYLMCLDTAISGPRLIRAWKRRHWIEHCFRTLKHLLATGACQVHNEDAYYGHLVLRLMGCLVLFYTSRVICTGQLTMEIHQSCNLRRIYVALFTVSSSLPTRDSAATPAVGPVRLGQHARATADGVSLWSVVP